MSGAPAMDAELAGLLSTFSLSPVTSVDMLEQVRPYSTAPVEPLLEGLTASRRELTIPADDGSEIALTIFAPSPVGANAPCVLWLHGGGMIMGDRFSQIDIPLEWLQQLGAVVVTVEYRLAPEFTGTTPVEDAHNGLRWIAENSAELGIDPARIIVAGTSAGGGIAAGVALLARDRGTVPLFAQVLICPMLDHRNSTTSSQQYTGSGTWPRETNEFAWNSLLGPDRSGPSIYSSPALAEDLSGLPTTYVDAGTAEVFRDEDVAYATAIWAAGGQAELHVWAGGFHGFDALFPQARLSAAARETRTEWLTRLLSTHTATT